MILRDLEVMKFISQSWRAGHTAVASEGRLGPACFSGLLTHKGVSKNRGVPKSSILMGFSL